MLNEKAEALETVGLYRENGKLHAVRLSYKSNGPVLDGIDTIELSNKTLEEGVNPLYMNDNGKELVSELKQRLPISALQSNETLVRPLHLKLKKERDIDEVVAFQAEPLLPYPVDEAVVDWIKVATDEDGSALTIFAAKKEHIASHLEEWNALHIDPEVVSTVPVAIASFISEFVNVEKTSFFAHIGMQSTTCGIVSEGKVLASQFVPKGMKAIIDAVAIARGIEDKNEAYTLFSSQDFEIEKTDGDTKIVSAVETLRLELMRSFIALSKSTKGEETTELFICGEGGACSWLKKSLCEGLEKKELSISEKEGFNVSSETLSCNAIPIGLALTGLPKNRMQVNFRKDSLAYPKPWKRLTKPIAIYFSSMILLSAAIWLCGNAYFGYQEDKLKESYGDLLASLGKQYEVFEAEYETKHPSGDYDEEILPIETLTSDDLFDRLDFLENEIRTAPEPIALMPNTPRVSDFLAWLCTHPNVVFCDADKGDKRPLVKIENFSYSMVKRPEEKKRNIPYQVKVEIEFSSPTPKLARELHDVLIEPNDFVDTRGEVKWSSNRGRYKTSFFLKDKTYYPKTPKG